MQGVYYYFYQLLRNEAEARAQRSKKLGNVGASVGMLASLIIASLAGYKFSSLLYKLFPYLHLASRISNSALYPEGLLVYCFHFHVWRCFKSSIATPKCMSSYFVYHLVSMVQ